MHGLFKFRSIVNPIFFIIGFIFIVALTACQARKTPIETTQHFWSAIAKNQLDTAKKYCSSKSQHLPATDNARIKESTFDYGKIVIDGLKASVETQFISPSSDKKLSFTTFLVNENEDWKIDCQRSINAFNSHQVFKDLFNELSNLGKDLNKQIEQQLPIIEKEIESFGKELKQQLDTFEGNINKSLQKKQKDPYQNTI